MFVGRIKSGLHWFSDKICFVLVVAEKSHGKTFRSSDFCHTLCIATLGLDEALDKVSLKYELWIFFIRRKCIMIFFEIKISDFFGAYFFAEKSNDNDEAGSRNAVTVVELERMMFVGRIKSGLHWFSDKICFVLVVAEKCHGKVFPHLTFLPYSVYCKFRPR